ncbi:hypothetical protein [Cereibacter sphaeroides]|uniref:hypothetical protein n=1 Tax=Cereibacter sphaeroides TaxID=1063 RepID=UPI0011C426B4|nr:hypothetical protein [Cereibacter sphaeroides]
MIEPDESSRVARSITERLLKLGSKAIRSHWSSYGKLNDPRTWLIGLSVAAGYLLIVYLIV